MSSEKRRRGRVQGGWASTSPSSSGSQSSQSRRPTTEKSLPAWTNKTVDVPKSHKFVYEEPAQDLRQKLPVRTIDKPGIYDLDEAHSPSPPARVRLFYNFIDPRECEHIYHELFNELPWKQKTNTRNGISYQEPRLTAWYGDHPYRYSGVLMPANTNWPPVVQMLRERLEVNTGCSFNSVLANLYRDGHDSVDWHSDDEPGLGYQPTIASLSFGDTRMFEFRKKPPPEEKGDYTYQQHVRIPLPAGSLVIMEGNIQETWQHRVPKEYHDRDARINLTYRVIYPE